MILSGFKIKKSDNTPVHRSKKLQPVSVQLPASRTEDNISK